jgi:urease accessory protein
MSRVLLDLLWLASPALPVGGFSYSEGLEAAVEAGLVHDQASAGDWLADQLHLCLSRSDLAVVARAVPAWTRGDGAAVATLNDWVAHTRESHEFAQQTQQMGRSLAEWLRHRAHEEPGDPRVAMLAALAPAPTWPVSFALAAERTGAPLPDTLAAYAFGWAENLVQAAVRAVPLGQTAGQRILGRLADEIPRAVDTALALADAARQSYAPMLAILSAQHETQYSRLFRS